MPTHTGTIPIETPRLLLRKFEHTDAQDIFANWATDPEVARYVTWYPHGDISVTNTYLENQIAEYEKDSTYHWAIVLKQTGQAIGDIKIINLSEKFNHCEVGYCMSKTHWGKGIMTESLRAVIGHMFKCVGLYRVAAMHDVLNPASGRVMAKSGMQREGTLRGFVIRKDGSYGDAAIYAILKTEWDERESCIHGTN